MESTFSRLGIVVTAEESLSAAQDFGRLTEALAGIIALHPRGATEPTFDELLSNHSSSLPGKSQQYDLPPQSSSIEDQLKKLDAAQLHTNAFVELFKNELRLDIRSGSCSGLRFAYKDVFASPGRLPGCGIRSEYFWNGPESTTLERLINQGAVAVGATNLDPHCYTALGFNRDFGRVNNPHDIAFAVGGSSSGSAAIVAMGAVGFALGTDTGGSTRIPASLCGIYGLKPTHGAIQDAGVAPLSKSQDTVGILAGHPEIIRVVFDTIAQTYNGEARASEQKVQGKFSIGYDRDVFCQDLDPEVDASFSSALVQFKELGATVHPVVFPPFSDLNVLASVLTSFEAAQVHLKKLSSDPQHYPAPVRKRLLSAALVTQELYDISISLRGHFLQLVLSSVFSHVDFLLCPTLRKRAPRVDAIRDDDSDSIGSLSLEMLRQNRPFSYLGLPSLNLPAGQDKNGIPIGLQLIGRPYSEHEMLLIAKQFSTKNKVKEVKL